MEEGPVITIRRLAAAGPLERRALLDYLMLDGKEGSKEPPDPDR